ncbi:MAG: ABC-F family ATP-binding cassette domain-containing protein [Fimbriimonadaceae bacterium]|nr:ABC-F family ATP-binding cassette domain-containing protein [Fimbriimonadaceae bacterium]
MLLNVTQVHKHFVDDIVIEGATFRVDAREKVALVGRNGAGKTTLLRMITGQYAPDQGSVTLARGAKIGYLRQEQPVATGLTVLQEAQAAKEGELALRQRLEELQAILDSGDATPEDLDEYALVHEHFLDAEGYSAETDIRVVLKKLGFTEDEFEKPTDKLSGGERTRLALARLLLEAPDLLILDEPTNHLDLQATEWLEQWIKVYHGAVLLVSHDRTFLESTAERFLELRERQVFSYPGPFSKYRQLREEEDARLEEVARRQELEIAKMDEYVRRFMNSQRTAQARGRLKLLNRLIENKVEVHRPDRQMQGGFGAAKRSGDLALTCEKLTVGFPGLTLIDRLDWTVRFGERWGIIGENGAGKSTLMKVALGELEALSGRTKLGANVQVGYFTQDASDLDPDMSPIDFCVYELDMKPADARNLLGRFLLSGDDVFRPIKTLSGGEKNKLSLAKLTQLNPNLLVLDEPTNHLDMASRDALVQVIREYQGTLILISHDRYLLSQVTTHILDIRRAGPIQYPGTFDEYRAKKAIVPEAAKQKVVVEASTPAAPVLSEREISKEIQRLQKRIADIENEIADAEAEIQEVEQQLAELSPTADILSLTRAHQQLQEELAGKMAVWEAESAKLESYLSQRSASQVR